MLLPSSSPGSKPSTDLLFPEGFQHVSIFFLAVVDKNPGWLRNIRAAVPAQSHGSNPAPANLCREGQLILGWPSGMLLEGTHHLAGHPRQASVVDRQTDGWTPHV